jgi:ferritin-like metal-binding protein YciE
MQLNAGTPCAPEEINLCWNPEAGSTFSSQRHNPMQWRQAMAAEKTLNDLFLDTLKDIYYAERQIVKTLPKMAKAAQSPELKAGFEKHLEETHGHVERLEQVFELLGKAPRGKTCDAILGIIEEGKEIMDEFKGTVALDAGLVSAAQAVEHYEIARYGTLKTWATQLGMKDAAKLLDATLQEELATDQTLSELATSEANQKAA